MCYLNYIILFICHVKRQFRIYWKKSGKNMLNYSTTIKNETARLCYFHFKHYSSMWAFFSFSVNDSRTRTSTSALHLSSADTQQPDYLIPVLGSQPTHVSDAAIGPLCCRAVAMTTLSASFRPGMYQGAPPWQLLSGVSSLPHCSHHD